MGSWPPIVWLTSSLVPDSVLGLDSRLQSHRQCCDVVLTWIEGVQELSCLDVQCAILDDNPILASSKLNLIIIGLVSDIVPDL